MSDYVINLANPKHGNVEFKVSKFPDGQQDITINLDPRFHPINYLNQKSVLIKSRLRNFSDLELIICATKAFRNMGFEEIHLYIPYILGARSDRQFVKGGTSYLRDVVAPILNAQNYKSVTCIDVHSDVAPACINNLSIIDNKKLFNFALKDYFLNDKKIDKTDYSKFLVVSPDAGAMKKIYKLCDSIGYNNDIIICSKHRDENGKLSKTVVPITGEQHNMLHSGPYKDFFIVDDICDGGRTFINIAKEIKEYFHESGRTESNIYLVVTHGIFSSGFDELKKYFKKIYCTNSYFNNEVEDDFLIQKNVF
jgi:ribose-phosphate pyrophosphokinase